MVEIIKQVVFGEPLFFLIGIIGIAGILLLALCAVMSKANERD